MKKLLIAFVLALVVSVLVIPTAAFAHGGNVNPLVPEGSAADDHVDCRSLEIYGNKDNGNSWFAAKDGLLTAGENTDVVSWSHCD